MTVLLVALGAAVGAPLRYLADQLLQQGERPALPRGTLAVNVLGSLLFGLLAALAARDALSSDALALLGTGFCGALTTYSTFGYETVRLAQRGAYRLAVGYVTLSVALGLGAAALGWWAGGVVA